MGWRTFAPRTFDVETFVPGLMSSAQWKRTFVPMWTFVPRRTLVRLLVDAIRHLLFSKTYGLTYSPINFAKLSCSIEVVLIVNTTTNNKILNLTWHPSSQSQQVKNPSSKGMLTFFWGRRTVEYSTYNEFITCFHESWI